MLWAVGVVFAAVLAWGALGKLGNILTIVLIGWFLSLAMEPPVRWLLRHRVHRRGSATGLVLLGGLVVGAAVVALFGGLFVSQLSQLISAVPDLYASLIAFADQRFHVTLPDTGTLLNQAVTSWGGNVASGVIGVGGSILGGLFTMSAILLVAFYMVAAGPRFRAAIAQWMAPRRQREVMRIWEISQEKVSDFLASRLVLAALSTVATFIALIVLQVPYSLPLALFTGVVSQFIPTIGTYIGGALPVIVALTVSPFRALVVLAFIVGYQQLENFILSPRVSEQALALNPAVAFLSVIAFGAVFGPLGAFVALPVTATIQAVAVTYLQRHELVDPELRAAGAPRQA